MTVDKPCVAIFRIVFDHKPDTKRVDIPRWEKAALCQPGKNTVVEEFVLDPAFGKAVAFEVGLYNAQKGQVIYVDGVRFLKTAPGAITPSGSELCPLRTVAEALSADGNPGWKVLGEEEVADSFDLAVRHKDKWVKPNASNPRTMEQIEKEADAKLTDLTKSHPKAVLGTFRRGQKGYDPANPDKEFTGWSDTVFRRT